MTWQVLELWVVTGLTQQTATGLVQGAVLKREFRTIQNESRKTKHRFGIYVESATTYVQVKIPPVHLVTRFWS